MVRPVVISVESTGTHFAKRCVEQLLKVKMPWNALAPQDGGVFHVYPEGFRPENDVLIADARRNGYKIVVPMRHPVKALITHYEHATTTIRDDTPYKVHARSFGRLAGWDDVFFLHCERPYWRGLCDWLEMPVRELSHAPANVTPQSKHSVLRKWFEFGEWGKLNDALDGAEIELLRWKSWFNDMGYFW